MADAGLEERRVEVNDPKLSDEVNRRLTEAVRETVGRDQVLVPIDRPHASRGDRPRANFQERMTSTRAMVVGTVCVAIGVGFVILTALIREWLLTGAAFVVLAIALGTVVMAIMGLASTVEYPDPLLVAWLGDQGIRDPEVRFSELVAEFTPVSDGDEHRSTAVEDDPGQAAAEQAGAGTPSGGPSEAVGPGGS